MKKAIKFKTTWLIVNILLSASAVVGIPMIPLGFVFKAYAVGIIGIVFVAHGFFGLVFYWQWFGKICRGVKVVTAFERDRLTRAEDIAEATQMPIGEVNRLIRWAIEKEWITGMLFLSGELVVNPTAELKTFVCEYCGTQLEYRRGVIRCEGCGAPVKQEVEEKE